MLPFSSMAKLSQNWLQAKKATFHLNAGELIVGASLEGAGLCALNPARQERETTLKNGDTKAFRVFTSNSGDIDILPTTL